MGYRMAINYDSMLSCFHLVLEPNGQTDRQRKHSQTCYINIARQYADAL